jgi:poly(rC)-binding protein 2/3/4
MSTIEVHIPNTAVGSVIGKGGSNIAHIRQISGAKVKLHNSEQGANDRVLELSGTQEQTHAAQSLVQAYMQSSMGAGILPSSGFAA